MVDGEKKKGTGTELKDDVDPPMRGATEKQHCLHRDHPEHEEYDLPALEPVCHYAATKA